MPSAAVTQTVPRWSILPQVSLASRAFAHTLQRKRPKLRLVVSNPESRMAEIKRAA
jgi:hypothetical protein